MRVSVAALALGLVVSLPLAIAARNRPAMRGTLLALASVVQTVPGLALLALFYPLLLALSVVVADVVSDLASPRSDSCPRCWRWRSTAMLPVLRNTITGLSGIDPAVIEAAQGVGMTPAPVATFGGVAAGAAGHDGRYPHRARSG